MGLGTKSVCLALSASSESGTRMSTPSLLTTLGPFFAAAFLFRSFSNSRLSFSFAAASTPPFGSPKPHPFFLSPAASEAGAASGSGSSCAASASSAPSPRFFHHSASADASWGLRLSGSLILVPASRDSRRAPRRDAGQTGARAGGRDQVGSSTGGARMKQFEHRREHRRGIRVTSANVSTQSRGERGQRATSADVNAARGGASERAGFAFFRRLTRLHEVEVVEHPSVHALHLVEVLLGVLSHVRAHELADGLAGFQHHLHRAASGGEGDLAPVVQVLRSRVRREAQHSMPRLGVGFDGDGARDGSREDA